MTTPAARGSEICKGRGTLWRTCVQDNFVTFIHEGARGGTAEAVGGSSDEDTTHVALPMS